MEGSKRDQTGDVPRPRAEKSANSFDSGLTVIIIGTVRVSGNQARGVIPGRCAPGTDGTAYAAGVRRERIPARKRKPTPMLAPAICPAMRTVRINSFN